MGENSLARASYPASPDSQGRAAPFLPYIHSLRAVAIVAVVGSHVNLTWDEHTSTRHLLFSLTQNSSAIFLFVSGFLFQHLSARFTYSRYLRNKLQNVILPYVICSLPALVYEWSRNIEIFAPAYPRYTSNPFLHAALALLTAAHMPTPLWFIPMIAVLYLAAPVLIAIDRRPRLYWLILPMVVVAMFCHRPKFTSQIGHSLLYFTPAYLFGMWTSHYRERVMRFLDARLVWFLIVWLALEIFCVVVLKTTGAIYSRRPFSTEAGIVDINLVSKLVLSLLLLGTLAKCQNMVGNRLDYLGTASFGVFFVHEYVIERVQIIAIKLNHPKIDGTFVNFVALLFVYVAVSLVIVALVRKLARRHSRYIIGC